MVAALTRCKAKRRVNKQNEGNGGSAGFGFGYAGNG